MAIQIPSDPVSKDALINHKSYYKWLCELSGIDGVLAQKFFLTDFRWNEDIPDDANRAKEAREELREKYARHILKLDDEDNISAEDRTKIDRVVKSILGPACVFEVLVMLAKNIDDMMNMEEEPHISEYFERLMMNAGFDFYDEEDYDMDSGKVINYWQKCLDRWLDRDYLADGEGGLFPLTVNPGEKLPYDQRKRSLWEQMGAWINQEF